MAAEFVTGVPHPALRGSVLGYVGYREDSPVALRRVQPAAVAVPLILSFGPGIAVDGVRCGSFVAGLYDRPAVTEFVGEQLGLEVLLTPFAARGLLRRPLDELARRAVGLEDLLGPAAEALPAGLAALPDWPARFARVDDWLRRRLRDAPPIRPAVREALARLEAAGGRVEVERLARDVGYSRRQLSTRFAQDVGLGPKAVGRILRLERTCALLRSGTELARAAHAGGYADQPHLNREARALAGVTPRGLADLPNVQDGHPSTALASGP